MQNRATRVITKSRYDASSSNLFSKLGCYNLLTRRKKQKGVRMFQTINELTPLYLREIFEYRCTGYNLRNSENTLFVHKTANQLWKTKFYLQRGDVVERVTSK